VGTAVTRRSAGLWIHAEPRYSFSSPEV
jgi:hypothetical protein